MATLSKRTMEESTKRKYEDRILVNEYEKSVVRNYDKFRPYVESGVYGNRIKFHGILFNLQVTWNLECTSNLMEFHANGTGFQKMEWIP